jgi:hypothetical protein
VQQEALFAHWASDTTDRAATWLLAARAQQSIPVIGFLSSRSPHHLVADAVAAIARILVSITAGQRATTIRCCS